MKNTLLFLLVAILVGFGFSAWKKPVWEKTYYKLFCPDFSVSSCTEDDIRSAYLIQFQINKPKQEIISWGQGGLIEKWENCIIVNKNNWKCDTESDRVTVQAGEVIMSADGEITYYSYPYDPKESRLLYVGRTEYWFAKIKMWFGS